jgi:methanogenic corrinoid protein MtbC1
MDPEMNAQDKRSLLIDSLLELEENTVLELVKERLAAGEDPLAILNEAQEGMRLVGQRYEQRQYYISGMMMAGEIFREVMELVQPVMAQRFCGNESGHILLGTVQGDIHDIGKNIFGTLLRCHGFTVTDIGVDTPSGRFVEETLRLHPDIVALSGLLTVSYEAMQTTVLQVRQLEDINLARTPFIIGGGLMNAMVCSYVGAEYWANDAMFGVELCKQIVAARRDALP